MKKYVQKGGLECSSNVMRLNLDQKLNNYEVDIEKVFVLKNGTKMYIDKDQNGNDIKLGSGSYGTVYKGSAYKKNNFVANVAIKAITKTTVSTQQLICEELITVFGINDIDEMVKYYGYTFETFDGRVGIIYIFMEYINGQNLGALLTRSNDRNIQISFLNKLVIVDKLLDGLDKIHSKNICHRDIKPENIMISLNDSNETVAVKFVDFGFACIREVCNARIVGTPLFTSPEMSLPNIFKVDFRDVGTIQLYKSHDIWALGISICELLFGKTYTFSRLSSYLYISENNYTKNSFDHDAFYGDINNAIKFMTSNLKMTETNVVEQDITIAMDELEQIVYGLLDIDYKKRILLKTNSIKRIIIQSYA